MATVATLVFEMAANIARLQSDMAKANKVVTDTMGGIKGAVDMAKTALTALGIGLSVDYFKDMVKGSIDAMDALHGLALKTGNTVEALSSLKGVARSSHTDLEQIAVAAQKLSKNMLEVAETGKGKAAAALQDLGIQVADNEGKLRSNIEVMKDIAEKLDLMTDRTKAVAYAQLLLGKAGAQLLPFLHELANAGELHASVTTKQAEESHKFNTLLGQLEAQSTALKRSIATGLLPALISMLETMNALKGSAADLSSIFEFVGRSLQAIGAVLYGFWSVVKLVGEGIGGAYAILERLSHLDLSGAAQATAALRENLSSSAANAGKVIEMLTGSKFTSTTPTRGERPTPAQVAEDVVANSPAAAVAAAASASSTRSPMQQAQERTTQLELQTEQLRRQADITQRIVDASQDLTQTTEKTRANTADTTRNAKDIDDALGNAAGNAFKNFNDLHSVLAGLASDLAKIAVRSLGGGASISDFFKAASQTFGIGESIGGKFAGGGSMSPNTWNLVGERGPELVWSGAGGSVVPNGAFGGDNHTYYIDSRGADAGRVAMLEARLLALHASVGRIAINANRDYMASLGIAAP